MIGELLDGRYRIEALLGHGGMGAVYRATHVHMDQRVAIKVLRPHLTGDPTAARRFAREARGTFALDTEHAVKVHDFGATEAGLVYLVMEYLDGRTVADELEVDGPIAPARACRIAAQVCEALAAAHRLGFVHRDIKPDNVMLVQRGDDADFVKVLDFGLAKLVEGRGGAPFSIAALTQNDIVFGTPEYIAPEQATGSALDGRADLYAVGCTLFEMIAGRTPFVEASPMRLLAAHVRAPAPRLRDVRPELTVPDSLEAVVARCLAKDPAARWPSAEAMATELRRLAPGLARVAPARVPASIASSETVDVAAVAAPRIPETVSTQGIRRSTRTVIAAIGIITTALAVVVALAITRSSGSASITRATVTDAAIDAARIVAVSDAGPVDARPPTALTALPSISPTRVAHPPTVVKAAADPELAKHLAAAESARRAGNRLRQLAEADAALTADPHSMRARFLLGEALLVTGDAANGCKYLRQAKAISDARALLASGRCPAD